MAPIPVLVNLLVAVCVCVIILMILQYGISKLWPSADPGFMKIVYAIIGLAFFIYFVRLVIPLIS